MTNSSIIIFDTEYTSWEGSFERQWSEPWEHREIIQIGAMKLATDNNFSILEKLNVLVVPTVNPKLSNYIQNLTGITQELIDQKGVSFPEAIKLFCNFCENDSIHAFCWGSDELVFKKTCQLNNISFEDYFHGFYDIRDAIGLAGIDTASYQSGTVYKSVGLSMDDKQHDALNDVHSIVHAQNRITPELIARCGRSKA